MNCLLLIIIIIILSITILISLKCFNIYPEAKEQFYLSDIHYIVSSNENQNYLSFWPYVKHNVEKLGMTPILIYTGKDKPKKPLKGKVIYKPCPPDIPSNNYAQIIRLFAPSLFPNKYCVIADIDSIPLRKQYFTDPLRALPQKNGWVFWNDWSLGASCTNWPMCFNLAKGRVWMEVFPYAWDSIDYVIQEWLTSQEKNGPKNRFFIDQYYFGKHLCKWINRQPYRFKEYRQSIYNLFVGPRGNSLKMNRRMKIHRMKFCQTSEDILNLKHNKGVAWISRLKDGEDPVQFKKILKSLKL